MAIYQFTYYIIVKIYCKTENCKREKNKKPLLVFIVFHFETRAFIRTARSRVCDAENKTTRTAYTNKMYDVCSVFSTLFFLK